MKITIDNIDINDDFDYHKGALLLRWQGISGGILTTEQRDELEKKIVKYLWGEIQKYFPNIKQYCTEKTGKFNRCTNRNHRTPIICIHGHFYMQYIIENNSETWNWESIDFEPYRFNFNEDGYLKGLLEEIERKHAHLNLSKFCHYSKQDVSEGGI